MKLKISFLGVLSIFSLTVFAQPGASAQKLATFINIVEQTYVDTVNSNLLVEEAINSMLTDLDKCTSINLSTFDGIVSLFGNLLN